MNHQMGDLPGHIFPGLAFVAWAALWCVVLLRRGGHAVSRPWDTGADAILASDPAVSVPWEAWAKIVIPFIEMAGEVRWLGILTPEGATTIYAHITMDVAVILSGAADLLTARGKLPSGSDRIALVIALFIPAMLFAVHGQHGPVAGAAHGLFANALFVASALVLIEQFRPAPIVRWGRILAVALAGAWFMHTGWLLYVSDYDLMSDALLPRIHLQFAWYALGAITVLMLALASRRGAGMKAG
jgi:hypothetical protein